MSDPDVDAVVLAAGSSRRMGEQDKMLALLEGTPLIVWSVSAFERSPSVRRIVVTVSPQNAARVAAALGDAGVTKLAAVIPGGSSRAHSVLAALEMLESDGAPYVAIHDGARPFLSEDLVEVGVAMAREAGAAVPAVPSPDTAKLVCEVGLVVETPMRDRVWLAQTPQIARLSELLASYRSHCDRLQDFTDDASLLEDDGIAVRVFKSTPDNFKITEPADLERAQILAAKRSDPG